MAASLPMTWAATWQTDSGITGLTLPGMIELPGCTSGSTISPRPARGPEPSHRMSLAIFIRLTATVLSAPLHSTTPSSEDWAWKWLSVSITGTPSMADSLAQTAPAKSGWLFTPVPTAVPPSATSDSPAVASLSRLTPRSTWPAWPSNSWPSRMGVASCRCVRPVLTIGMSSSAFRSSSARRCSSAGISAP